MKEYIKPSIKIFEFDKEKILTLSGGLNDNEEGNMGGNSSIIIPKSDDIHN